MLKKLPLRLQVGLSFFVVITLLVLIASSALVGLNSTAKGISEYRGLARDTNLANEVKINLLSMRINVKDYLITHDDRDHKEFLDYLARMDESLSEASREITNPERVGKVRDIIKFRDDYADAFEKVIVLTKEEDHLLLGVLDKKGAELTDLLTDIMTSAFDDNDATAAYLAGWAQEHLQLGRFQVARYEMDHDPVRYENAHTELVDRLGSSIDELDSELQNPARRALLETFRASLVDFERDIERVNVVTSEIDVIVRDVLDVVGPEIVRLAVEVKESVKDEQDTLGPQVEGSSKRTFSTTAIVSVIAVILSAVLAFFLVRAIWKPLGAEPRLLLDVIGRISHGDLSSVIVGQDKPQSGVFAGMLDMRQLLNDKLEQEKIAGAQNAQLRQALENTSANVLVSDQEHSIVYVNNAAQKLFELLESDLQRVSPGFEAAGMLGRPFSTLYDGAELTRQQLESLAYTLKGELLLGERIVGFVANPILTASPTGEGQVRLGTVFEWVDLTDIRREEEEKSRRVDKDLQEAVSLKKKVDEILGVVSAASKGDLTQVINVDGQDAIGQVGSSLKVFFTELSSNLLTIRGTAESLTESTRILSGINASLGESASTTSEQAGVVSTSSELINDNVGSVATAAVQLTSSVREISSSASKAASVATEAVKLAERTNNRVKGLSVSSRDIGNVIKVINSIAEQTNLLALNATIEAARAGDSGKGFAVVANEVKELAKQTAEATDEISKKIGAIQSDSEFAVNAIEDINNIIGEIHDIQTTIASAVEEQDATTREISKSVNEAATGTAEIVRNIVEVAKGAGQSREETIHARKATSEQAELTQTLHTMVSRFKLSGA